MKVGIFGGSFNPPHVGHLNSLAIVQKKLGLHKVYVIPAAQSPLKAKMEGPTTEQRLKMTELAVDLLGPAFTVDDQEIKRGGKSYTIDTIMSYRKKYQASDLHLIIGLDKFEELTQWKDFSKLLEETNIIVTSRPGFEFPSSKEQLNPEIAAFVEEMDFNFIELKSGRSIQFVHLQDTNISSTELRKWLRIGKNVQKFLPLGVESYIKDNKIYQNLGTKIGDYEKFAHFCGKFLSDKKGIQVRGFDLRKITAPSEFAIVASGTSTRHTVSLAENLVRAVKEEYNVFPLSLEGTQEGRWVVVDYGSLIVHVFYDFVRQEYALENLWNKAIDMGLKE